MAGSLNRRLIRLENGYVEPCEECGFDGTWEDVEVEWVDHGTLADPKPKRCGACGRPFEIIVTWDGIPDPPEAA